MNKALLRKALAIVLCMSVLSALMIVPLSKGLGGQVALVYGVTSSEIQAEKDKQAAVEAERKKTQQEIKDLKGKIASAEQYMKTLDEKMGNLDLEIYQLGIDIAAKEVKIEETKAELAKAEEDKNHQYDMMKLRIKFMYEHNEQTYLAMFLEADSLADMLNKVEYISKLSEYDRNMLEELKKTIEYVASVQAKLETELAELNTQKVAAETKRAAHEVLRVEKEAEVKAYLAQVATLEDKESGLEDVSAELKASIAQMEEEMKKQEAANNNNSSGTVTNPYESGFIWPTVSKRITSRYGYRASGFHSGVDIGATKPGVWGDPIYAAADGTVTRAEYGGNPGYWIWVYHGNGMYTIYMHCSSFKAKVGDKVKQGDVIALMGSTGYSTGAHLHFSVWLNGGYVNPEPYIGIK